MTYMQSLGLDVKELITKGGPAIAAAAKVIEDPALPEITCHVLRLNKLTEGKDPGGTCARRAYTEQEKQKGIGLTVLAKPLRLAVWTRQNPILAGLIGASVAGAFIGIGYLWGKK